jgi:hypothetical protein
MTSTRSDAAAEAMREACAKLIEQTECYGSTPDHPGVSYTSGAWRRQIAAAIRALPVPATVESRETALQSYIRTGQPLFQSKVEREEYERSIGYVGPSDTPALEQAEPVAWLDMRNEPALDWTKRHVATNPKYVERNGRDNFQPLYAHPQAVDAEAIAKVSLDIADEFIGVCEAAARHAKHTGNTFVLDRHRVSNLIQAKLARLLAGGAK